MAGAAALAALISALFLWSDVIEGQAHYQPEYPQTDLTSILQKEEAHLTKDDYKTLLVQTGVGAAAVGQLWRDGRKEELLQHQQNFFRPIAVKCLRHNLFTSGEYAVNSAGEKVQEAKLVPLQAGDILITPCSHFFGWRNGHAGIVVEPPVVDASGDIISDGMVLESVTVGVNSRLRRLERWESYPAFVVLRLRGSEASDVGRGAAILARQCFYDVPYQLLTGLWEEPWQPSFPVPKLLPAIEAAAVAEESAGAKRLEASVQETASAWEQELRFWAEAQEKSKGTQCAHLIWSCYRALGYDLDSDGGRIVTPRDLMESPLLQVVQIYGINPMEFETASAKLPSR